MTSEMVSLLRLFNELLGLIFCELVNEVVLNNQKPDFLTRVKNNNLTYQDSLHNMNMALNEIRTYNSSKIQPDVKNLKAHELISVKNYIKTPFKCIIRMKTKLCFY